MALKINPFTFAAVFCLGLCLAGPVLAQAAPPPPAGDPMPQPEPEKKGFFSRINPFGKRESEPSKAPAPRPNVPGAPIYCPSVTVQPGTAALTIYERGKENDPKAVRYQARFVEFARECVDLGAEVGLRIGLVGRALVGPVGTPGQTLDVPIRFVVMDDKRQVLVSTATRLQVTIPPGQTGVTFTHVEELGSVPMPPRRLRGWEFRIGFDSGPPGRRPQG